MEAASNDGPVTVTLTDLRSANGTYLRARGDVILSPATCSASATRSFA
jgi:hypothetical protein